MIALIQRVRKASVTICDPTPRVTGSIDTGLLILLGVHETDTPAEVDWLSKKCVGLRIFPDADDKMNCSLAEYGGDVLVVSQFTLYGNAEKGNRPSFIESARPEKAEPLYEAFCAAVGEHLGKPVQRGEFGAMMDVELINWGPVTLPIERRSK